MIELPHILAADDDTLAKLIFGAIFALIWAISAFVSWVNKKQQAARRERVRQELERSTRYGQSPQPPPLPPRRPPQQIAEGIAQRFPAVTLPPSPPPVPYRRPVPPPLPKAARRSKQPQPRRAIPIPPPVLEEVTPPAYVNITQPAPRAKPPTVDATSVRHWLTPATLRQQFILTEILQPPLAIRPDPHDRV